MGPMIYHTNMSAVMAEAQDHYQNVMSIMVEAISFCCRKEQTTEEGFFMALQSGSESAHSRLRYALAKYLSGYLGSIDDNLESVYVYGSTMDDNARRSSDIDLLVKVKSKNSRTWRALHILDSYLLVSYRILLGDGGINMNCMLDVHMIDEDDVIQRKNYGSLVTSPYTVPVKVWSRA
jgi:hypothetical protein